MIALEDGIDAPLTEDAHPAVEEAVQAFSKTPLSVTRVGRSLGLVTDKGEHVMVSPRGPRSEVRIASRRPGALALWMSLVMLIALSAAMWFVGPEAAFVPITIALAVGVFAAVMRGRRTKRAQKIVEAVRVRVEASSDGPVAVHEVEVEEIAARSPSTRSRSR